MILHIIESQLMASKVLFESLQLKNDATFSIKICYRCNQVSSDVWWYDNGCGVSSLSYSIRKNFTISCTRELKLSSFHLEFSFNSICYICLLFYCLVTFGFLWHKFCFKKIHWSDNSLYHLQTSNTCVGNSL